MTVQLVELELDGVLQLQVLLLEARLRPALAQV
jgi:hypothetical protein